MHRRALSHAPPPPRPPVCRLPDSGQVCAGCGGHPQGSAPPSWCPAGWKRGEPGTPSHCLRRQRPQAAHCSAHGEIPPAAIRNDKIRPDQLSFLPPQELYLPTRRAEQTLFAMDPVYIPEILRRKLDPTKHARLFKSVYSGDAGWVTPDRAVTDELVDLVVTAPPTPEPVAAALISVLLSVVLVRMGECGHCIARDSDLQMPTWRHPLPPVTRNVRSVASAGSLRRARISSPRSPGSFLHSLPRFSMSRAG